MIEIKNVFFKYESGEAGGVLDNIDLKINKGEVVLLCGESGCGKTTLTRLLNGLIPHYYDGELTGEISIAGHDAVSMPLYETAKYVGSVFQNPRSQFFNVDTNSELAFSCENQGLPASEIIRRRAKTVEDLNIRELMNRSIFKLSGGEKQKIACGCVHTASPDIIVLDEPSSNLDSKSTMDLAQIIAHWKNEGKTVVIAEHRLHYLRDIADRIVYMRKGKIEKEFSIEDAKALSSDLLARYGLRPLSLKALRQKMQCRDGEFEDDPEKAIRLGAFHFSYKNRVHALGLGSLSLPRGKIIAVIGKNGAGKSTFARCLCGLNKRFKGTMKIDDVKYPSKKFLKNTYMVMQDVNHQLFTESVLDEVLLNMDEEDSEKAEVILSKLGLLEIKNLHPMSLSGGQKQRVAIAGAIASEREIIIFDEPTSGLDLRHMEQVSECLKALKEMGKTLIIVSHDLELIVKTCDIVLHFENGKVIDKYSIES